MNSSFTHRGQFSCMQIGLPAFCCSTARNVALNPPKVKVESDFKTTNARCRHECRVIVTSYRPHNRSIRGAYG